jgi:5-formyltetrahydrofolate cyclo-ligase
MSSERSLRRRRFRSKAAAREAVWDALQSGGVARFPFPPQGRIPNFAGAALAAELLLEQPIFSSVRRVKVNPDAPQLPVRAALLQRGVTVFMPTPRLRAGFLKLDPRTIPFDQLRRAASLSGCGRYAIDVPLRHLPQLDLIVTGSVAVTPAGARCGKGHGYGDIEYAILRELGHAAVPVATTVHELQIVDQFPTSAHDLPLALIATPKRVITVENAPPGPEGIDWSQLSAEDIEAMPVLAELRG